MATGKATTLGQAIASSAPISPTIPPPPIQVSSSTNPISTHPPAPSTPSPPRKKISASGRSGKKPSNRPSSCAGASATSLPINVPDWSKILREEHRDSHRRRIEDDDGDSDDGGDWLDASGGRLPPHEFLARTRMASFSVHEGIGRTLKGRDLSRVRNAIFEKIGFQD